MSTATTLQNSPPASTSYPLVKSLTIPNRLDSELRTELTDRQERLSWWDQERLHQSRICQIGAGGLGGPIAKTLVQMGAATDLVDFDTVEVSNLNRQLFRVEDLGEPKPHALLDNISPYTTRAMTLRGFWMSADEFAETSASDRDYDIYSAGVDSDQANLTAAKLGIADRKPVVFINVSRDGEACRVFIQRPEQACFACYKPRVLEPPKPVLGCTRTPAIADILQVAAGLAVRAIVGELMGEPIGPYNCRDLSMPGFDHIQTIKKRPGCPLCGGDNNETGGA